MKGASSITTLFLDVGGVLLTNAWDHLSRRWGAARFKLDLADLEEQHHLTYDRLCHRFVDSCKHRID